MNPGTRAFLFAKPRLRPYIGQIASHCFSPASFVGTSNQIMSRTRHVNLTEVFQVQLLYPNWSGHAETASGADATITASVEYPAGTFTQVKFSGSASGTIPNGGNLLSDVVSVYIPKGATFYTRSYFTNPAGIVYSGNGSQAALGEGATFAASGVVDKTMSGTVTTGSLIGYAPIAIIGMTSTASFALIGDSKCFGANDTFSGGTSAVGELARSFGDSYPHINLGISSTNAYEIVANGTSGNRTQVARYCSHVLCQLGINDITNNHTAATLLADVQTIRSYFPSRPFFQCTLAPHTTSTDSWATTANQTVLTSESQRIAFNNIVRAGIAGHGGFIEIADQVESARDSGLWMAPGYTPDGLHESASGYLVLANSGAINPISLSARIRP